MFFLFVIGLLVLGDAWWGWFAWRRLPRTWQRVTALLFIGAQFAGIAVLLSSRGGLAWWHDALPRWWHSAILVWHLLMLLPWMVWQTARGVAMGLVALARKIAHVPKPAPVAETSGLSRREFLSAAAVFTPPLLTLGAAALGETQLDDFRLRRIEVPLLDLPPALDGLTIAHVSDIHVGRFTYGRVLDRIVEETNRLEADLVTLTGDLINDSLRALPPALELVRGLRARHAVVTCEGNHDLIENPRAFYTEAGRGGLPLLRGDTATLTIRGQRVQILGLPWAREGARMSEDARALLARRDPSAWPLLLAHHPHAWDLAEDIPLTLSGHTHGGQLMLSEGIGFGPWWYRYWSGLYQRSTDARRALVVSNGVGNWFPVRIQAPAEILHLTLRRANRPA